MVVKGRRSRPEERLRAVQLLKEGNGSSLAAEMFGVSRAILFRWQQKYDAGGPGALDQEGAGASVTAEPATAGHGVLVGHGKSSR